MRSLFLLLVCTTLLSGACAGRKGPDRIPDLPETSAVLALMESYRDAMRRKDVDAIVALASPRYYESLGTPQVEDDLYHADLAEKLAKDFDQVSLLKLDLEVLRVEFDPERTTAKVEFRYDLRFQLEMPSGRKWYNALDVNQLVLENGEQGWKFTAGL